jgi:predicted HAD superfamily Cof-like phosphohydrolase
LENRYYRQVKDFHIAFSHPASDVPTCLSDERKAARISWMQEELDEYKVASTLYDDVDALIDLIYFTIGTLVEHGVEPDRIFDIVHDANMSKLFPDGKPRYREDGKTIKPDGWIKPEPKIEKEINRQIEFGRDEIGVYQRVGYLSDERRQGFGRQTNETERK